MVVPKEQSQVFAVVPQAVVPKEQSQMEGGTEPQVMHRGPKPSGAGAIEGFEGIGKGVSIGFIIQRRSCFLTARRNQNSVSYSNCSRIECFTSLCPIKPAPRVI